MRVGILGAGQLCQMLIKAGQPLDLEFKVYAPMGEHCIPDFKDLIQGDWDNQQALMQFANTCDVITFESENIPARTIEFLSKYASIHPGVDALVHSQDRLKEKQVFSDLHIPNVEYAQVDELSDLLTFIDQYQYPVVLKKRRMGYDGKGQWRLYDSSDLENLNKENLSDCIVEKMVSFNREVSIIGVRSIEGSIKFYDLCENTHQHGILHRTENRVNDRLSEQAQSYLSSLLNHFDYVGCCALELFEVNGALMANEMAPRVHNSGHWTIEGAQSSQFENHLRAITQLPIGNTNSLGAYQMINILGSFPHKEALSHEVLSVHNYGKSYKPGRKRGHITFKRSSINPQTVDELYQACVGENTQVIKKTVAN